MLLQGSKWKTHGSTSLLVSSSLKATLPIDPQTLFSIPSSNTAADISLGFLFSYQGMFSWLTSLGALALGFRYFQLPIIGRRNSLSAISSGVLAIVIYPSSPYSVGLSKQ